MVNKSTQNSQTYFNLLVYNKMLFINVKVVWDFIIFDPYLLVKKLLMNSKVKKKILCPVYIEELYKGQLQLCNLRLFEAIVKMQWIHNR